MANSGFGMMRLWVLKAGFECWYYTGFDVVLQYGYAIIFIAIHVIVSGDSGSALCITLHKYSI